MNQLKNWMINRFGPACLAGITVSDWLSLLIENRFRISPRYWGKVPYLSVSSVCTSAIGLAESAVHGRGIKNTESHTPLMIVGSWRSGTTFLHTLMCLDQQFGSPSLFQTMYPHSFILSEPWLRPMLELGTPTKRFMDNMAMNLQEPHEDEMALAIMSGRSNMLSWAFPRNAVRYDKFLDFNGTSDADQQKWKDAFAQFVQKMSYRTGKPQVLKSPNHTARIRLLLELYPDAKFLHIYRNPYSVFRSMVHMATAVTQVWGLQYFPPAEIPEMVVETYKRLYDAYLDEKSLIPDGQLTEIRYEDFAPAPVETLERVYSDLSLPGFDAAKPLLEEHVAQRAAYKRNKHKPIDPNHIRLINDRWSRMFEEFGYEKQSPDADA
ncbi:MAG: sulfotransferase [Planctomycetaceae bacterium]